MLASLRNRLIFSHVLPVLLIIPLTGLAMAYVLETRLLLPMVYSSLADDATLMAAITGDQPLFWQSTGLAQALVDGVEPHLSGQLSVLTLDGRMLAGTQTSGGTDAPVVELPDMSGVRRGETVQIRQGPLAEAFAPAFDSSGRPAGVIRMTTRLVTVSDAVYQLRYLLGAVLLLGVLAGSGLGSYLAFQINRPIQRVTSSIQSLAAGNWQAHAPEAGGPREMRALAMAVNALVDRLGSLERARRQLLANLVHELGRPLGAMRSGIQALQGAGKDPQLGSDLLHGLDEETLRLQRLLEDLARLHDEVLGGLEINKVQVSPDEWLARQLPAWEAAARVKGLNWQVNVAPGMPLVELDSDRLGQALGNLLSNAIKFTPAGGRVVTRAWLEAGRFRVEVSDTGPGIPAGEQANIFQPFYRGLHGRKLVEGMGLGLGIARDIAAAHGGDITIQSEAGQGSRFTLWIPVEP